MSNAERRLQPNAPRVAGEVIDGEAVLIDLETGTYYSMNEVGALLWEQVTAGLSIQEMVDAVLARYDVPAERARADVSDLLERLECEALVVPAAGQAPERSSPVDAPQRHLAYVPPALEIYRDLRALLALDPPTPELSDIALNTPDKSGSEQE